MRKNWIYLISFIVILGNASCEEDEPAMNANEKRLIDIGVWRMTTLKIGTGEIPLDDCFLDNEYHFKPENEYTVDEGASKCDPADPQTVSGEWSLTSNGTGIVFTVDGTTKITIIDELSSTSLKIHYDIGPLRYEETYEPK